MEGRKLQSAALFFTILSAMLLLPPLVLIFLVLGTIFGMAPGMLGTSFIGDQVGAAMTTGRQFNIWIVVAAALWTCAVAAFAKWWIGRLQRMQAL